MYVYCILKYLDPHVNIFFVQGCVIPHLIFFPHLFIYFYFWLCWVFIAAHGLSLVAESRGYSLVQCTGFSLCGLLLLWSTGSRARVLSSAAPRL